MCDAILSCPKRFELIVAPQAGRIRARQQQVETRSREYVQARLRVDEAAEALRWVSDETAALEVRPLFRSCPPL
jgi:hypothetical protein